MLDRPQSKQALKYIYILLFGSVTGKTIPSNQKKKRKKLARLETSGELDLTCFPFFEISQAGFAKFTKLDTGLHNCIALFETIERIYETHNFQPRLCYAHLKIQARGNCLGWL